MHVVDTTLFFAPRSGGVKRYLLSKRAFLASRRGLRHTLVVPGAHAGWVEPGLFTVRGPRWPGTGGYRVPLGVSRWRAVLRELAPDVIECGDAWHGAWAALAAGRALGVPVVAFAHSDVPEMLGTRLGRVGRELGRRYLRHVYRHCDLVLAPSGTTARRLRDAGIERVETQTLGVDTQVFHPSRASAHLRASLGVGARTRVLAFAGRLGSEKRVDVLRAAVESLGPDYHLVVIGARRRERVSSAVTLLPYEPIPERLASLLASADAFVHAGSSETFGLVALEAMACGLPVIGTRGGAVEELVDDDVGALAERSDSASMRAAILRCFAGDVPSMRQRARHRVSFRYGWEAVLTPLVERYRRLITSRAPTDAPIDARAASLP